MHEFSPEVSAPPSPEGVSAAPQHAPEAISLGCRPGSGGTRGHRLCPDLFQAGEVPP